MIGEEPRVNWTNPTMIKAKGGDQQMKLRIKEEKQDCDGRNVDRGERNGKAGWVRSL